MILNNFLISFILPLLDHILSSLLLHSFPDPSNPVQAYTFTESSQLAEPMLERSLISILPQDTEVIWYFGDLNFRLKGRKADWGFGTGGVKWSKDEKNLPSRADIISLIDNGSIDALVTKDELTHLRLSNQGVLSQFTEPPITFLPSYKLNQISGKTNQKAKDDQVDTPLIDGRIGQRREYSTKRLPAYCDRILYYSDSRHSITSLHYTRVTDYFWSDHDPVVCMFHLEQVVGIGGKRVEGRTIMPVIQARLLRLWHCNHRYILLLLILVLCYTYLVAV